MPAHQPEQELHVVADGSEPVSDGVEPVEAQQVERHGAEPCQHLHSEAYPVAVRVFTQLGVAHPLPGVLVRPPVSHVLEQGICGAAQTRDLVAALLDRPSFTLADGLQRNDKGAAWPDLLDPLRCLHRPEVQVLSRPWPRSVALA